MSIKLKKYSIVTLPDLPSAFLNNMRGAGDSVSTEHPGRTRTPLRPGPPLLSRSPLRLTSSLSSRGPLHSGSSLRTDSPLSSRSPLRSRPLIYSDPPLLSRSPLRLTSPLSSRSPLRSRPLIYSDPPLLSRSPLHHTSPLSSRGPLPSDSPLRSRSPLQFLPTSRSRSQSPLRNMENIEYGDKIVFRKFLAKSIMTILKRTENLDVRLRRIESELGHNTKTDLIVSESEDEAITLPLQSVEQLEDFDATLKNKDTFKKMLKRLKFCEGRKVTITTNLILKKLISDELATEFSWHGRKGKKSLKKYFTCRS
ncbi:hypothetical protein ABEB36_015314 [Hypothenemus hampei]|uniref:DUF4806 domain-containing protein n=1 Tax=Hypothenemus hampei TaxID=57062 RepID=A0ABD1DZV6_HYPHA